MTFFNAPLASLQEARFSTQPVFPTIFQGQWQGETLCFQEEEVAKDGDCGFTALDYTRQAGVNLLVQKADDEKCRTLALPEIRAAFTGRTLPQAMQERKDYITLRAAYDSAYSELDGCVREINNELKFTGSQRMRDADLLRHLESTRGRENELYQKLEQAKTACIAQEQKLDDYCGKKTTYNAFVCRDLNRGDWLGFVRKEGDRYPTSTLDILALEQKLEVVIWHRVNGSHTLECVHHFNPAGATKTVHLIHTDDGTHYNILRVVPVPSAMLGTQPTLSITNGSTPINNPIERAETKLDSKEGSLHFFQIFERLAEDKTVSGRVAVIGEKRLTYKELNEQANQLAHYLLAQLLPDEAIIGLFFHQSPEFIISMLAVWKAGLAFMPLSADPDTSLERLLSYVEGSNVNYILSHSRFKSRPFFGRGTSQRNKATILRRGEVCAYNLSERKPQNCSEIQSISLCTEQLRFNR